MDASPSPGLAESVSQLPSHEVRRRQLLTRWRTAHAASRLRPVRMHQAISSHLAAVHCLHCRGDAVLCAPDDRLELTPHAAQSTVQQLSSSADKGHAAVRGKAGRHSNEGPFPRYEKGRQAGYRMRPGAGFETWPVTSVVNKTEPVGLVVFRQHLSGSSMSGRSSEPSMRSIGCSASIAAVPAAICKIGNVQDRQCAE